MAATRASVCDAGVSGASTCRESARRAASNRGEVTFLRPQHPHPHRHSKAPEVGGLRGLDTARHWVAWPGY